MIFRKRETVSQHLSGQDADLGEGAWTLVIRPRASFFQFPIKEMIEYRDLLWLFVRRDFKTMYKQTVLGPVWIFLNPLMTTVMFTVVFGKIASIPTDGIPDFLFYMAGNILWTYFADCLTATAGTFLGNAGLFGKVYFPRMVMPVSAAVSKMIKFGVQLLLFLVFVFWYLARGNVHLTGWCLFTPVLLLQLALLGLGVGMILASLTAKYRDLQVLVGVGVQLWMYATPIVYPLSEIPQKWQWVMMCNPVSFAVECFRCGWLGCGTVSWMHFAAAWVWTLALLTIGMLLFNRTQRNFMDTI